MAEPTVHPCSLSQLSAAHPGGVGAWQLLVRVKFHKYQTWQLASHMGLVLAGEQTV